MKPPTRQRRSTAESRWWQSSSSTTAAAATAPRSRPQQKSRQRPTPKPVTRRGRLPARQQQSQQSQQHAQPQTQQQHAPAAPALTASPMLGTPLPLMQLPAASPGFPLLPPQSQEPLLLSPPQVGGVQSSRHLHKFLQQWLQINLPHALPHGLFQHRAELRSGLQNPHKRADNIVYLLNRQRPRYIMIELDPLEHRGNGLVEDVFRVNWFYNARFSGGKLYALKCGAGASRGTGGSLAPCTSAASICCMQRQRKRRTNRCQPRVTLI